LQTMETLSPSKLHSQVHTPHLSAKGVTFSNFSRISFNPSTIWVHHNHLDPKISWRLHYN
jgi:hypothetical protein